MSYKWHVKEKTSEGQSIAFILIKKKLLSRENMLKLWKYSTQGFVHSTYSIEKLRSFLKVISIRNQGN